jgi:hypothetical protein
VQLLNYSCQKFSNVLLRTKNAEPLTSPELVSLGTLTHVSIVDLKQIPAEVNA